MRQAAKQATRAMWRDLLCFALPFLLHKLGAGAGAGQSRQQPASCEFSRNYCELCLKHTQAATEAPTQNMGKLFHYTAQKNNKKYGSIIVEIFFRQKTINI